MANPTVPQLVPLLFLIVGPLSCPTVLCARPWVTAPVVATADFSIAVAEPLTVKSQGTIRVLSWTRKRGLLGVLSIGRVPFVAGPQS